MGPYTKINCWDFFWQQVRCPLSPHNQLDGSPWQQTSMLPLKNDYLNINAVVGDDADDGAVQADNSEDASATTKPCQ